MSLKNMVVKVPEPKKELQTLKDAKGTGYYLFSVRPSGDGLVKLTVGARSVNEMSNCFNIDSLRELIDALEVVLKTMEDEL